MWAPLVLSRNGSDGFENLGVGGYCSPLTDAGLKLPSPVTVLIFRKPFHGILIPAHRRQQLRSYRITKAVRSQEGKLTH